NSADLLASLETKLAESQNTGSLAEGYKDGMSVYYVPVKHDSSLANNVEGYYGVVRNHWYNISINSISKVGHGVFNPDEALVPDEAEDVLYYLGVNINILAWKIVNQNEDL
ncbi:MAG: Mfa1 fimbrilin C-terminal domain-containing protein, partial [Duncaniella sp.]|nr:Mfa1 fimbrilin C-terminal domain-containing protein [Duncaniella sp.]